jgi:hypothetical protein
MHKTRIEAFSDAVFAILITIMVLELKIPHTADISGLYSLSSVFYLEQKENKSLELAAALREIVSKPDLSSITYPSSHK